MRNRKKLKYEISNLKYEIFEINYQLDKYFINYLFDNLPVNFGVFFKQYNFLRLINPKKINFLILKVKKFYYPLTKEQIKLLKKNGYKINYFICITMFFFNCVKEFLLGIMYFFMINCNFVLYFMILKKSDTNDLFIYNLSKKQINSFENTNHNIVTWIKSNFNLKNHLLVHNNKFCKNKYNFNHFFLIQLKTLPEIIKFNLYFFKILSLVILDFFFLRIKQLSIFSEMVKYCSAISKDKSYYQDSYFFFGETPFFRPLYTYSVGENVYYIEYQFKIISVYLNDGIKEREFDWKNLTWSKYILWDEQQINFIKKNQLINANYYILGPVSFGTVSSFEIKNNFKDSILVFDVIPYRKSFLASYNQYAASFRESYILKYLEDISELNDKFSVFLKPKRKQTRNIFSKKYNSYLEQTNKLITLNPEYSAYDVIKKFDKIICYPFSSTAYIAKKLEKKVCYYDVVGLHEDFGNYYNGIPIVRNLSDLKAWSKSYNE